MKIKLIIVAVILGLFTWWAYEVISVVQENAAARIRQLEAVDLE